MGKKKTSKKKLSGEIDLKSIELGLECRKYLQWYYAAGGNDFAFGEFKGKVILNNQQPRSKLRGLNFSCRPKFCFG